MTIQQAEEMTAAVMHIYTDNDGDKVGLIEEEEYVLGTGIITIYKKKADNVRPVNEPHRDGLMPSGKNNWREEAISTEKY